MGHFQSRGKMSTINDFSIEPNLGPRGEENDLLIDAYPDRIFFTMIPNFLIDFPISPIAFRVYVFIKRRCGESEKGKCWESSVNIAHACNISTGALSKAKTELLKLGLIRVKKVPGNKGEYPHDEISVMNAWAFNNDYCQEKKEVRQKYIYSLREKLNAWRVENHWRVSDEKRKVRKGHSRRKEEEPSA